MKTIGLVGGIGWASSAEYYRLINEGVNKKLGGHNFAQIIIFSINYDNIHRNNQNNDWEGIYKILLEAAKGLKKAGAEAIMLGANTMHYLADRVEEEIGLPLINVASVTTNSIAAKGLNKVALLGTRYTMELDFYKDKLAEKGITTVLPNKNERDYIDKSIYAELAVGQFNTTTKDRYLHICNRLLEEDEVEGIILGCTEIPLLISQKDLDLPLFSTTDIHANAAVDFITG